MNRSVMPFRPGGRDKVGDATMDLVVLGVVGLGLYWVYNKFFSGGSGAQNNADTKATNLTAAQASEAQATSKGIVATLTPNNMAAIANSLYTLGTQVSSPSDLGAMNNLIDQVNNLADLNGIISAFGTKEVATSTSLLNTCYALGYNCTAVGLGDFVRTVYQVDPDGTYLAIINQFLFNMGINYQF